MTSTEMIARLDRARYAIPQSVAENSRHGTFVRISNLRELRRSLYELYEIPAVKSLVEVVLPLRMVAGGMDQYIADTNEWADIQRLLVNIQFMVHALRDVLLSLVPTPSEEDIRIRLPDAVDYRSVVSDQQVILRAIEQLLLIDPEYKHSITIRGWETGSLWIILGVGTTAVTLLGQAIRAAVVVRNEFQKTRLLEREIEDRDIDLDVKKKLAEGLKKSVDRVLDYESRAVGDGIGSGKISPEDLSRVKETVRVFAELVDRRMEIHPALMEPAKAREIFPDFKALDTVTSAVKHLTEAGSSVAGEDLSSPTSETADAAPQN